jgi:hypothetical protein
MQPRKTLHRRELLLLSQQIINQRTLIVVV